ncbi:MAG: hypothetical protein JSS09_09315, partial [Verrucomicrobia bacterium]|nr:hypothetical protein [Verrucomicrobiota bacterium]
LLNPEEREHYLLELTKNLFLEGLFSDALYTTGEFLIDFPSSSFLEEVELIQVLCYLEDPESHLLFALQAEKFLDHHPNNIQAPTLRIHLFNTYLNQASSTKEPLQSELLDKAATHLYVVFDQKQHKILKENLQWLADYYYNLSSFTKATVLFEHLLQDPSLEASTEENIYKLSTLFSKNFELEKKIALLEKWTTNKNSINTPLQKHFLFDLAGTYKALNNSDKALELYDLLILSSGHSKIGAESLLERSKILFSRFTEEEKAEDNPLCMEIIHHIKDLENQKNLSSEPLHLEAALEYVEYKASLVKDLSLRREKRQELLKLCQENTDSFYSEEQLQDKKEIFSAYKKFIEAQVLLCDPTSSENKERSILLLQKLKEDCSIPASLQERVQASLELNSSL